MYVLLVRRRTKTPNNSLPYSRFQQAYNFVQNKINLPQKPEIQTETLILPVVPAGLTFPYNSDVSNLKGIKNHYNIPQRVNLQDISISSIFPVNKDYDFIAQGSNPNGFDYVNFFSECQTDRTPFRLIAFDPANIGNLIVTAVTDYSALSLSSLFKVYVDSYFIVEKFQYFIDKTKDISYTLDIKEFTNDTSFVIDWEEASYNTVKNVITQKALKLAGLI